MYDPTDLLHRISDHTVVIMSLCTVALVFNYAWYWEMIRLARRDRVPTLAPATNLFYLAHDGSYLVLFHKWFVQYDNWFCELFFAGILVTFTLEVVMMSQTLRYGRSEIAPSLSQRTYVIGMLAAAVGVCGIWALVKVAVGDDLYLMAFMVAIAVAAPFGTAQMLRRGTRRGSSRFTWFSFTMIGLPYAICTLTTFGPHFQTLPWTILCIVAVSWGAANIWIAGRLPEEPQTSDPAPATIPRGTADVAVTAATARTSAETSLS
jgi:hypothetical protein